MSGGAEARAGARAEHRGGPGPKVDCRAGCSGSGSQPPRHAPRRPPHARTWRAESARRRPPSRSPSPAAGCRPARARTPPPPAGCARRSARRRATPAPQRAAPPWPGAGSGAAASAAGKRAAAAEGGRSAGLLVAAVPAAWASAAGTPCSCPSDASPQPTCATTPSSSWLFRSMAYAQARSACTSGMCRCLRARQRGGGGQGWERCSRAGRATRQASGVPMPAVAAAATPAAREQHPARRARPLRQPMHPHPPTHMRARTAHP